MRPPVHSLPSAVDLVVEIPAGAHRKHRTDGRLRYVSPLPSPFAYGSAPGWPAADGDPADVVVLGVSPARGAHLRLPLWGRVCFIDAGRMDDKWICAPSAPTPEDLDRVERFFRFYARIKRLRDAILRRAPSSFQGIELRP